MHLFYHDSVIDKTPSEFAGNPQIAKLHWKLAVGLDLLGTGISSAANLTDI
jgi:hypothetical protein